MTRHNRAMSVSRTTVGVARRGLHKAGVQQDSMYITVLNTDEFRCIPAEVKHYLCDGFAI